LTLPTGADVFAVAAALRADPAVLAAEPNYLVKASQTITPTVTPNDPYFFQQWGLTQIGAPEAWAIEQGNPGYTIAILDTGIDLNHPDLVGRLWVNPGEIPGDGLDNDSNGYVDDVNGWNFVEDNNLPQDDSGHGTHVAGIAAASGNNGIGIAGTDWRAALMPVRVLNAGGAGTHADVATALRYAADKGAQVINMSFGAYADSQVLRDAIAYAAQTALLVGAAGNDGRDAPFYPAAYPQVLAVAATGPGDVRAAFSNFGAWVDIAAPGQTIWSTVYDDGYVGWSGTSMAAPFVSGAASLVWARYPTLSLGGLRRHLQNTTADVDTPNPAYTGLLGWGRLDLAAALRTTPAPRLEVRAYAVDGVASGRPEPDTTASVTVTLANTWADASGISGTLSTTDTHITIGTPTAAFGDIAGDGLGSNASPFRVTFAPNAPYNAPIVFTLNLQAAEGYNAALPITLTTASSIQNVGALTIASDTTWTADRQYIIGGAVRVIQGVTLTVAPGTQVLFQPAGSLTVSGTLVADAVDAAPITFEGAGATAWGGLTFTDASMDAVFDANGQYQAGSILRNVQVFSATTGVRLQNAAPFITGNSFAGNADIALAVEGSSPRVIGNRFTNNGTAIMLTNGSLAQVEGNSIISNTTGISGSGVAPAIQDNDLRNNNQGLYLNTSGSTMVSGNLLTGNETGAYLSPGWPTGNRTNPDVAYNHGRDEYMVVWEDARISGTSRIYGQRLSGEGELRDGEIGLATSGDHGAPHVVYDPIGDAYLAVWQQRNGTNYALAGQMIASSGTPSGTVFTIDTYTGTQSAFALAANTTAGGYLVVWNDATDGDYDVYARQITASGVPSDARLTVIADTINQMDVAVTYNTKTSEYFIVWAEDDGLLSGWDLYGRRLRTNGTFNGIPFTVSAASGDQRHPTVAAEPGLGWYTVVWDDSRNGQHDLYGRRVTSTGVLYGQDAQIFAASSSILSDGYPRIIFSPSNNEHIVLWTEVWATGDVVGQRVSTGGGLVVLGDKFSLNTSPAHEELGGLAHDTDRDQFLAVFVRWENSQGMVFGQRFAPDGILLDNPGSSRNEATPGVNFPIVLGTGLTHNTIIGNNLALMVNLIDADLLVASGNNIYKNTLNGHYLPPPVGNANFGGNYWATADQVAIANTFQGPFTISPTLSAPDPDAPPVLWRLFFASQGDPTPQEAVEGTAYGPVGAEQLDLILDFSRPMDISHAPYVTIGNGSETAYTPTHLIRFGEWISPTRWLGSYMVDWYTGDGTKRVSIEDAIDGTGRFAAPTDRRFTFEVSILAVANANAEAGWNQIALHWQPANLSTLAGYHVYRGEVSGGPYDRINTSIVTASCYTDTTVINNHDYFYKVRVVNTDLSERDYSGEIPATPGDPTAPATPVVLDDGITTWVTTTLHARWTASDPESGIEEYQYCIGTTRGGCQVVSWTSAGAATEITRTGLHLTNSVTYYVNVKARNAAGLWSTVGSSDGILVDTSSTTVALGAAWNLIALPSDPANPAPDVVLAPIAGQYDLVYAYDGCAASDPWRKYDPHAPAFANDLTTMDIQHGYWVRTTGAVGLRVSSTPPGAVSIPLCPGWNLIGYPSSAPEALPAALASIAGKYDLVYAYDASDAADPWKKYDPNAPAFADDLTEMGPGKGYWIRLNQATTLVVGP